MRALKQEEFEDILVIARLIGQSVCLTESIVRCIVIWHKNTGDAESCIRQRRTGRNSNYNRT